MAKRRDRIRMTEDEIWPFIEEQKSLQVATLNRDRITQNQIMYLSNQSTTLERLKFGFR